MKIYKDHRYENKYIKSRKSKKGKVLAIVGVGVIVISIIAYSKIMAKETPNNIEDIKETTYVTANAEIEDDSYDFMVGSSEYKRNVIDFLYSPSGNLIYKYSEQFGVDPNLIAAMAMQESSLNHNDCIPGGDNYWGYGVGLLQLESPSGQEITAYNYETYEMETEYITMENACNLEKNIKIGCMIFQNNLDNNQGNVFLALQSHNYGQPMLDLVMYDMYGDNIDTIKSNYGDTSWISGIKEAHDNPYKYLSDWNESAYGDGNYIENVLRFMPYDKVKYKYDNNVYTFDLNTKKVISKEKISPFER